MIETKNEVRKIEVQASWKGNFQTEQQVRGFHFIIDEPEKIGGENQGPTPLEYVLGAFNGCIHVVILMVAREINFQFDDIELSTTGWVDRRGLFGTANVTPYYSKVVNRIEFKTRESVQRLEELKEIVKKRCPLYNLFKDTGLELDLAWKVKDALL